MLRHSYPLPEAIRGERWEVAPGRARCIPRERRLYADLRLGPQLAVIRAHEMAHARWTPADARAPRVIPEPVLNAVEDARVNRLAAHAGVDFGAGAPSHLLDGALLTHLGDFNTLVLILVGALDVSDFERIPERAVALGWPEREVARARELAANARYALSARLPTRAGAPLSYARTLHVARWLAEQLSLVEARQASGSAPWGVLSIETPHLGSAALGRLRPVAEGTILRAPWRIATDGAVFRAKRVPRTGTVLCDASESMGMSVEQVATLARAIPAGIVAAYAGYRVDGVLRVLARAGRVASGRAPYEFPGANVVDGIALRWLAAQPEPRVWISDGVVTGREDKLNRDCTEDARRIVQAGQIRHVETIREALDFFRKVR